MKIPMGLLPRLSRLSRTPPIMGNRYAWRELFDLMDKIATLEGVDAKNIMMGPGSSDLLEKTAMVMFADGGNVVSADPSYMSLIRVAEASGSLLEIHSFERGLVTRPKSHGSGRRCRHQIGLYLQPEQPDRKHDRLRKNWWTSARGYPKKFPYSSTRPTWAFWRMAPSKVWSRLINEGKDVIIARTFSKIHGMAGLRVGYIVAQEATLDKIQEITRGGMGITYPSIFAASASMDDKEFQDKSRKLNAESREFVYKTLKDMGYDYVPSSTSFILFPIEMEGEAFLEKMTEQQVGVRAFDIMDKNWCRVSMGTMDEMKIFATALQKVLV